MSGECKYTVVEWNEFGWFLVSSNNEIIAVPRVCVIYNGCAF